MYAFPRFDELRGSDELADVVGGAPAVRRPGSFGDHQVQVVRGAAGPGMDEAAVQPGLLPRGDLDLLRRPDLVRAGGGASDDGAGDAVEVGHHPGAVAEPAHRRLAEAAVEDRGARAAPAPVAAVPAPTLVRLGVEEPVPADSA